MTDLATGLYAYGAIMAALFQRYKTGKGMHVDCNLLSSQVRTYCIYRIFFSVDLCSMAHLVNFKRKMKIASLINYVTAYLQWVQYTTRLKRVQPVRVFLYK